MEIECVGKISRNGHILIETPLIDRLKIGSTIKLKITIPDHEGRKGKKELSMATKRLLRRMENAKPLGLPGEPHKLSHSVLAEERMEKKFPCAE